VIIVSIEYSRQKEKSKIQKKNQTPTMSIIDIKYRKAQQMILIGTGVVITGIGVSAAYFVLLKKDMVRHQENDAILKRESELFAKKLEMEAENLSWNQNFPTPSEIKSSLPSSTVSSSILKDRTLKTEAHTYIPNIAINVQSTADYSDLPSTPPSHQCSTSTS